MPYAKRTRKTKSKALTKSSRKVRKANTMSMYRNMFPKVLYAKLKYIELFGSVNVGVGAATGVSWSCNGIYDVDPLAGGHQPMYFDQIMLGYDHYEVQKSVGKFTMFVGDDYPAAFTTYINDTTTVTPQIGDIAENHDCNIRYTSNVTGSKAGGPNKVVLRKTWSKKQQSAKGDANWRGTAAANPLEEQYFTIAAQSLNAAADPGPWIVTAEIDYYVKFTERKEVTSS